jgi:hypothetical protein
VSAVGVAFVASATKGLLEKICTHPDKWTRVLIQLITVFSAAAVSAQPPTVVPLRNPSILLEYRKLG